MIPYFGYARQDRKDAGRVPITAKLVANLITQSRFHGTWLFHWVPGLGYTPLTQNPWLWFKSLVIPWITLAILYIGIYGRVLRASRWRRDPTKDAQRAAELAPQQHAEEQVVVTNPPPKARVNVNSTKVIAPPAETASVPGDVHPAAAAPAPKKQKVAAAAPTTTNVHHLRSMDPPRSIVNSS